MLHCLKGLCVLRSTLCLCYIPLRLSFLLLFLLLSQHLHLLLKKTLLQRNLLLLQTRGGFNNDVGGECAVDVTIALVNWQPA